jgi:hypothetical protein
MCGVRVVVWLVFDLCRGPACLPGPAWAAHSSAGRLCVLLAREHGTHSDIM